MDIESVELESKRLLGLWDFGEPRVSEGRFVRFAQRADEAGDRELAGMAMTQIARAMGLDRRFDEGVGLIEALRDKFPCADGELAVRIELEHGRLMNSSGMRERSVAFFESAWSIAQRSGIDGLAVDAAHMLGIVLQGEDGDSWNERAMGVAMSSDQADARRWRGALLNNMGWSAHAGGAYERALGLFEQALEARIEQGEKGNIRVARWCIGRCMRSLGRLDVALSIQRSLEGDPDADGYVFEEIGECLLGQGRANDAKVSFAKAHEMLSADPWVVANESDRLARLGELGA